MPGIGQKCAAITQIAARPSLHAATCALLLSLAAEQALADAAEEAGALPTIRVQESADEGVRMATGGPGWAEAWETNISAVPAVDLALFVIGGACLWFARAGFVRSAVPLKAASHVESEAPST